MSHDNGDLFDRMINDPEIQRRIDAMSEQQHVTITYMGGLISILRETLYRSIHDIGDVTEQADNMVKANAILFDTASWDIRAVERARNGKVHPLSPELDIPQEQLDMIFAEYRTDLNHIDE